MPLGQSQDIPQTDPGGMATPRFWHRLIGFRHVISGSLALASLNHTCRNLVSTFPQRSPPLLLTTAACGGLRSAPDCRSRRTSSLVQLRSAVWTGDTRDTRPYSDISRRISLRRTRHLSFNDVLDCGPRLRQLMRRREFMTLLGSAAAWPLAARAQQVGKVPRIAYLSPGSASPGPLAYHDEFQRGLRELGYVEGRNIVIEYRFADGKFDRLDQLAAELVRLNVDIIVSVVTQASLAAKNATSTIPVVIVSVGDPVGAGLVASLARPGANVTGTSAMTSEVIGKSLALLKQ